MKEDLRKYLITLAVVSACSIAALLFFGFFNEQQATPAPGFNSNAPVSQAVTTTVVTAPSESQPVEVVETREWKLQEGTVPATVPAFAPVWWDSEEYYEKPSSKILLGLSDTEQVDIRPKSFEGDVDVVSVIEGELYLADGRNGIAKFDASDFRFHFLPLAEGQSWGTEDSSELGTFKIIGNDALFIVCGSKCYVRTYDGEKGTISTAGEVVPMLYGGFQIYSWDPKTGEAIIIMRAGDGGVGYGTEYAINTKTSTLRYRHDFTVDASCDSNHLDECDAVNRAYYDWHQTRKLDSVRANASTNCKGFSNTSDENLFWGSYAGCAKMSVR